MNRISRFFLSLLLILSLCAPVFASNEPSQLIVKLKDNTEKIFILANKPTITFDTKKMYVNTTDFSVELSNVQEFYFKTESTNPPTGIGAEKTMARTLPHPLHFVCRWQDGVY